MITELTTKQEKQLVEMREEYLAYGLSTEKINKKEVAKNISAMYEKSKLSSPIFWFCKSPMEANIIIHLLRFNLGRNLWANLGGNLRANLRENLGAKLWANLWEKLRDNLQIKLEDNLQINLFYNLQDKLRVKLWGKLLENLGVNLRKNLGENLGDNLQDNLRENLGAKLWANLWEKLREIKIQDCLWGQLNMYWIAYYKYPQKYLGVKYSNEDSETFELWENIGKSSFWWYPYKNICFVSERPTAIRKKGIQLHADGKPAVEFSDGWKLWFLNGVDVGEEIAKTPAMKLDPKIILTEKNAEVRREIVRKIGIERVCLKLGAKVINRKDTYELLLLNIGDNNNRPYLKMKNPSIGTYHIEGVHPDCKTVQQALNYRRYKDINRHWCPEKLT